MRITRRNIAAALLVAALVACQTESDQVVFTLEANRFDGADWSEPVNLGPVINSAFLDANAALSPDELTMYFVSTRPGGLGSNDIWSSRRQCNQCPWEPPVNLGAPINTDAFDAAPTVSENGQLFFFFSQRPGGFGAADIYVSERVSTGAAGDVWGSPVNLGADVNTAAAENGPYYVKISGEGNASLYFNRPGPGGSTDIYKVFLNNNGMPLGPAELVAELSDPAGADQKISVRTDGHELLFASIRAGGFGNFDIYVLTRQSAHDPWSAPANIGAAINTPDPESQPSLSRDGRTLIFTAIRAGGFGLQDLWMSTRTPSGN